MLVVLIFSQTSRQITILMLLILLTGSLVPPFLINIRTNSGSANSGSSLAIKHFRLQQRAREVLHVNEFTEEDIAQLETTQMSKKHNHINTELNNK